jgi:hypothetical protein
MTCHHFGGIARIRLEAGTEGPSVKDSGGHG